MGKRFFPKAFVVESPDEGPVLSMYVVPALFEAKHNPNYQYHSNFYSPRNGYIIFDFFESLSQLNTKRSFVMTILNVRPFLDIDPDFRLKTYRDKEGQQEEEDVCMNFTRFGDTTIQNLKVKDVGDRYYEFTYFDIVGGRDIANEVSVQVKAGDVKVMQTLVKYAMPCLLGWNGALDPKVIGLFNK